MTHDLDSTFRALRDWCRVMSEAGPAPRLEVDERIGKNTIVTMAQGRNGPVVKMNAKTRAALEEWLDQLPPQPGVPSFDG
jgi:hypothetical protein